MSRRPICGRSLRLVNTKFSARCAIDGTKLTVQKRDGSTLAVDVARAEATHAKAQADVGKALLARGKYAPSGVLIANALFFTPKTTRRCGIRNAERGGGDYT
jgi:hypothetical protein